MSSVSRLGKCEVCDINDAKYCCPDCEVKTCSLPCVNIHKNELNCSGIRSRVKFKTVRSFSNMDLQNDYRLLEEIGRSIEKYSKDRRIRRNTDLPSHLYRMRAAASRRRVNLHFLPRDFIKNKNNTSYLNFKTQELFWRIEWIFPHADDTKYVDERVVDSELLGDILDKYLNPLHNDDKKLKYYQAAGHSGVIVLLKAEKVPGERFYEMDLRSSMRENLSDKIIVEFPVFYIVLKDHKQCYNILTPDEEEEFAKQCQEERLERGKKGTFKRKFNDRGNSNFNKNLLFPVEDDFNDISETINNISLSKNRKYDVNEEYSNRADVAHQHDLANVDKISSVCDLTSPSCS